MTNQTLVERIHAATEQLRRSVPVDATDQQLSAALNSVLNDLLPSRFKSIRASVTDSNGERTDEFLAVVYDTEKFIGEAGSVPAEAAAAAFAGTVLLDRDSFEAAYRKLATVKQLHKADPPRTAKGFPPSNITLGVIFSRDSALPVESLGEAFDALNRAHRFRQWPELLVVAERGAINFAMQWPGEGLSADFLPPSQGVTRMMPAYIHLFLRPGGEWALPRVCWYLFGHIWTWTGEVLVNTTSLVDTMPKEGLTICAYQFNVAGELVALKDEEYITSRFNGTVPLRLQAPGGALLGHIRFIPWQDGGAIQITGKLPLEGLLVFLGRKDSLMSIRTGTGQISMLLPITIKDFATFIDRLRRQSNLQVKEEKRPSWIMSKVSDEGSRSPFYARLKLALLKLRDQVLSPGGPRNDFDALFEPVFNSLESARSAAHEISEAVREHTTKLTSGEIVEFRGQDVAIDGNIDRVLRKELETFLNATVRGIKDALQAILSSLGIDVGFLYQKPQAFQRGLEKLKLSHPELAEYLENVRKNWSESLIQTRNNLHGSWTLPKSQYAVDASNRTVTLSVPKVGNETVTDFVERMLSQACCLVEESITYSLSNRLPSFICLTEIPLKERRPELPERFRLALAAGGSKPWVPRFATSAFEQR